MIRACLVAYLVVHVLLGRYLVRGRHRAGGRSTSQLCAAAHAGRQVVVAAEARLFRVEFADLLTPARRVANPTRPRPAPAGAEPVSLRRLVRNEFPVYAVGRSPFGTPATDDGWADTMVLAEVP